MDKQTIKTALENWGINICTSRCVGANSFQLIAQSWGTFTVNAVEGTPIEVCKQFMEKYPCVLILIGQ